MSNGTDPDADEFSFFNEPTSPGQINQAIFEDTTLELGEQQGLITPSRPSDLQTRLLMVERFVSRVISIDMPGFVWTGKARGGGRAIPTVLAKGFFRLLSRPLDLPVREHLFSEHVELFLSCARQIGFPPAEPGSPEQLVPVAGLLDAAGIVIEGRPYRRLGDLFNDLIDHIRREGRSDGFRRRLQYRQTKANRQFRSSKAYVDRLFENYSRLLVLRVDLEYPVARAHEVTLSQAQADLKHFFDNQRSNSLFDPHVGYIWKLEDGIKRGLHFHVVLFLNGERSWQDAHLAERIGRYWSDLITKGRGNFHNCNRDTYRFCGIGMISNDDVVKRQNLMNRVIHYFVQEGQDLKLKGGRVFGRGELPKIQGTKLGRPRRRLVADPINLIPVTASSGAEL